MVNACFHRTNVCQHNKSAANFQEWQQQNRKELEIQDILDYMEAEYYKDN